MKTRLDRIILAMIVLTPIAALGSALIYWRLPSGLPQVSVAANILVAAGTFELPWVALMQIRYLNKQQRASDEAAFRPLLIPDGTVPSDSLWDGPDFHLHIKNAGPGLASNVEAVLLPPMAGRTTIPPLFYATFSGPIPGGEKVRIDLHSGGYMIAEDDSISGVALAVPPERTPETGFPDTRRTQPRCTARLTLTATDLLGIKHASIFDWPTSGGWLAVKLITHASADIDAIDAKHRAR